MGRDTDKYEYVEIALPRNNAAVQAMLKHAQGYSKPLRAIVRDAAIEAWMPGAGDDDDDDDEEERPAAVAKKPRKKEAKKTPTAITHAAVSTAASMLDDLGFDD